MDFNILTQLTNTLQQGANIGESNNRKANFDNLLEGIKDSLCSINQEEKNSDIDYELLQNILSNLQVIIQLENTDKTVNNGSLGEIKTADLKILESGLKDKENTLEALNSIFKDLIKDDKMMQLNPEKVNVELLDKIKELLKGENVSIDELGKKELLHTDISEKKDSNLDKINFSEVVNDKNSENEIKYDELEVSSLSNKANLIQEKDLKASDKELNTLESIADGADSSFAFQNSNTILAKPQNKEMIENLPIKEIRKEVIGEDVVETVRYLKANGLEEIKIKISPKELGDMTIKLIKHSDETRVAITISRDEVFNLVNKNIGDITKHLTDMNIKVKEISVEIKGENKNYFSDNLSQEFDRKNQQGEQQKRKFKNAKFESIDDVNEIGSQEDNLNILI